MTRRVTTSQANTCASLRSQLRTTGSLDGPAHLSGSERSYHNLKPVVNASDEALGRPLSMKLFFDIPLVPISEGSLVRTGVSLRDGLRVGSG